MSATAEATATRTFQIDVPEEQLASCAGASWQRAGLPQSSSRIGRRVCSWQRCRRSRAIGRRTTTGARSRRD